MSAITMQDESLEQYLTFTSGGVEYGVDIRHVKDINPIQAQTIAPVPWLSNYIKGIINQRGTIVPVIDVNLRFGKPAEDYHERTCVIVVELDDISIGMVIDAVKEVLTIPVSSLTKPPSMGAMSENKYVSSIASLGKDMGVVLLLDIHKLFYDGELLPETFDVVS
jgi:purine-binding chemotaxis protein CheW